MSSTARLESTIIHLDNSSLELEDQFQPEQHFSEIEEVSKNFRTPED